LSDAIFVDASGTILRPRADVYLAAIRHLALGPKVTSSKDGQIAALLQITAELSNGRLRTISFIRGFLWHNNSDSYDAIISAAKQTGVPHLTNAAPDGLHAAGGPNFTDWTSLTSLNVAAPRTESGALALFSSIPSTLLDLSLHDGPARPVCFADLDFFFSRLQPGKLRSLRLSLQSALSEEAPPSLATAASNLVRLEIDRPSAAIRNLSATWLNPIATSGTLTSIHLKAADLFSLHQEFCQLLTRNPDLESLFLDSCWFQRDESSALELRTACPTRLLRLAFLEAAGTHPFIPRAFLEPQTRLSELLVKPSFFRWFPKSYTLPTLRSVELRKLSKELGTTSWEAVGDALVGLEGLRVLKVIMIFEIMSRMVRRLKVEKRGLVVAERLA
jgi:hypothetical protein